MFQKKKCRNCGSKVDKIHNFCPVCGASLKVRDGLLDEIGEKDFMSGFNGFNLGGFPFNKVIGKLAKEIEKQFQDIDKSLKTGKMHGNEDIRYREAIKESNKKPNIISGGLSISISQNGDTPEIKIKSFGDDIGKIMVGGFPGMPGMKMMPVKGGNIKPAKQPSIKTRTLSKKEEEKLTKFPRTEPQTTVRRLTDRIIYEMELPGVKEKDIMVNKLQNSIEIKAFSKDKVFFKLLPISLPILRYSIKKGKLVLELKPEM